MLPLVLVLASAWAAPAAAPASVGVIWHDEATVDGASRQRLLAEIRAAGGGQAAILEHADVRAAEIVSSEIDRAVIERQVVRHERLQYAESQYRDGDMDAARATAQGLVDELHAEPVAPHATRMLVRCHVLLAQVRWTEGDVAGSEQELRAALVLDPDARISRRRAQPELVARFDRLREQQDGERARWRVPAVEVDDGARLELDGLDGLRAVPPGAHVVVVRRWGAEVEATFVDGAWTPPPPRIVVEAGVPRDGAHAERICESLELRALVLARRRGDRIGVQGYRCGEGFVQPWYGPPAALDEAVARALSRPGREAIRAERLVADAAWPRVRPRAPEMPVGPSDVPSKPWYRRAWVWSVLGVVVVAAVVTGAVVGTRRQDAGIAVDGGSFLQPR